MKTKEGKLVPAIIALTFLFYFMSGSQSEMDESGKIDRGGYGESAKTVTVTAKNNSGDEKEIDIKIQSRRYSFEECEKLYEENFSTICNRLLCENSSLDDVTSDLCFFDTVEGLPFEFEWRVRDNGIFDEDGKLYAHECGSSFIYLTAGYEEWTKRESFSVKYNAAKEITASRLFEDVKDAVSKAEEESRDEESFSLPPEIDGQKITYSDTGSKRNPAVFLLGAAAVVAIIYGAESDKRKEEAKRKDTIMCEYSVVLQKMVMYLSAGMNIRNVWIRIYEESIVQGRDNPIYREMGITVNELKNGVSESTAYKGFSKRTGIPEITRFTTLLSQNLKKGSTDLMKLLSVEAAEAFEKRKRRARVKGEEAGTKLLVPMVILMVVVMVIIMLPAFWSM